MLNNVALIYRKTGRQKAAEPYYLHALEIYEKHLGPEHAGCRLRPEQSGGFLYERTAI